MSDNEVIDLLQDIQKGQEALREDLRRIEAGLKNAGTTKEVLHVTGRVHSFAEKNQWGFYNIKIESDGKCIDLGTKARKFADPLAVAFDKELTVTVAYVETPNPKNPRFMNRYVESVVLHEAPAVSQVIEDDGDVPF